NEPLPVRPPGVEGYLPISGLMGVVDWVYQGTLNVIHPAATVLFLTFVAISLVLRKSFCGWVCPAGFISENLARVGRLLLGRTLRPPRWLDVPLRGLKYLLLGFFLWAIFSMTPVALRSFIESPYNQVADVKMLDFFVKMGSIGWVVLGSLVFFSVLVQGFWCRYLCPYGAVLGLFGRLSPVRVRRNEVACTDCGICDRVCGSRLPVSKRASIGSVECVGCMDCVVSCPVPQALRYGTRSRTLSPLRTGALVVAMFLVGVMAARITGHWYSGVPDAQMRHMISIMDSPAFAHPGMH
ncbi:MAG: 4Fe-4S binding protein, partial [Candidatus Eisenbacteria bacterium]|nr:4Fe-4S binding protein [Candidatus Eisenbacteria bacterium]